MTRLCPVDFVRGGELSGLHRPEGGLRLVLPCVPKFVEGHVLRIDPDIHVNEHFFPSFSISLR